MPAASEPGIMQHRHQNRQATEATKIDRTEIPNRDMGHLLTPFTVRKSPLSRPDVVFVRSDQHPACTPHTSQGNFEQLGSHRRELPQL